MRFLVADVDLFMKKLLHSATFFFACTTMYAQNVSDLPANSFPFNMSGTTVKAFDNRYEGVQGTHLFFDEFTLGTVMLRNTLYRDVWLNYDAVNDLVLIKKDIKSDAFELRKDMVSEFTLSDNDQLYHFIRLTSDSGFKYLLELFSGNISVYCKASKVLQRAEIGGAYNTSDKKYDQFSLQTEFFLRTDAGLTEFNFTKRGLTKLFPEKEKKISEVTRIKSWIQVIILS